MHLYLADHFKNMPDFSKSEDSPHAFRWIDHIQHLPGMLEQVQSLGLFVTFPKKEDAQEMSKAQLKKLAKQ